MSTAAPTERRRRIRVVARWVVTVALLGIVALQVDAALMAQLFGDMRWSWVAAGLGLYMADRFLATIRWWMLLRVKGLHVGLWSLLWLHLAANFFGSFLPTSFGADAARMVMLAGRTGRAADTVTASAVDRLIMIISTLVLAAVVSMVIIGGVGWPLRITMIAVAVTAVSGVVIMAQGGVAESLTPWAQRIFGANIGGKLALVYRGMQEYQRDRRALAMAFAVTATMLAARVACFACIAQGFGVPLGWTAAMLLWPIAAVVLMLPVTVGNFGLQEGTYIALLGAMGVGATTAVSMSLMEHALSRLAVIPGLVAWLIVTPARDESSRSSRGSIAESVSTPSLHIAQTEEGHG